MTLGRKFTLGLVGCFLILVLALAGKMDGNVTMALSVVVGGFFTSDAAITRSALQGGSPPAPPSVPGVRDVAA